MIHLSKEGCTSNDGAVLGRLEPVEGIVALIYDEKKSEFKVTQSVA